MIPMIKKVKNKKVMYTIIFSIVIFLLGTIYIKSLGKDKDCDCCKPTTLLEYNNAIYELLDNEYLEKIGFDNDITETDLGEKLITINANNIDAPNNEYLGCNVYEYKPVDCQGLIVVDKQGEYQLFGFCNFLDTDDVKIDAIQNLKVFNVTSSEDILNIDIINPYNKNILGITNSKILKNISDSEIIKKFYNEYKNMKDVGRDYYNEAFKGITEEDWQNGYDEYLEGQLNLCLNYRNGLSTTLSYYPATGYLDDRLSHYKLSEEFMNFLNDISK